MGNHSTGALRQGFNKGRILNGVWRVAVVFFLFAASWFYRGNAAAAVNPHDFGVKAYCPLCHTADIPNLSFDPVTTCIKCHEGNIGDHPVAGHPIGQVPRINIPANLPLTDEGNMVCYTCHEPHGRTEFKKMLRVEYRKLCASCHAGY